MRGLCFYGKLSTKLLVYSCAMFREIDLQCMYFFSVNHVSGRKVSFGQYKIPLFSANYSICFDNSFSMVTTKTIEFSWELPKRDTSAVPSVPTVFEFSLSGNSHVTKTAKNAFKNGHFIYAKEDR